MSCSLHLFAFFKHDFLFFFFLFWFFSIQIKDCSCTALSRLPRTNLYFCSWLNNSFCRDCANIIGKEPWEDIPIGQKPSIQQNSSLGNFNIQEEHSTISMLHIKYHSYHCKVRKPFSPESWLTCVLSPYLEKNLPAV